jgi:hypothetical protein
LEEFLEAESSVTVVVEELNKGVGLGLKNTVDTVVSQEIADLS